MTEAEWRTATNPMPMLDFIRGKASDRKLRLFACACCRRVWRMLLDIRYRRVVEVAEEYADGHASEAERTDAQAEGLQAVEDWRHGAGGQPSMEVWRVLRAYRAANVTLALDIAYSASESVSEAARAEGIEELIHQKREQPAGDEFLKFFRQLLLPYCNPLRDIFGNPFRPVAFAPEWRTDTVLALAREMYESRDFGAMPILADALQDAGCDNDDILPHCRGPGPHVRGCWVVDLVLGKE